MTTLTVGIASFEQFKERTLAIVRGTVPEMMAGAGGARCVWAGKREMWVSGLRDS